MDVLQSTLGKIRTVPYQDRAQKVRYYDDDEPHRCIVFPSLNSQCMYVPLDEPQQYSIGSYRVSHMPINNNVLHT